jgi:hypothetical protein
MIKKIAILIIGLVFLMSTASAEHLSASAKPVVLITECNVLAPDGITTFTAIGKEVIYINDKVTITCKGELPEGMAKPKKALRFNYANTGIQYLTDQFSFNNGLTMDWKEVITPSGHFKLKATIDISPPTIPTIDLENHDKEVENNDDDLENDD